MLENSMIAFGRLLVSRILLNQSLGAQILYSLSGNQNEDVLKGILLMCFSSEMIQKLFFPFWVVIHLLPVIKQFEFDCGSTCWNHKSVNGLLVFLMLWLCINNGRINIWHCEFFSREPYYDFLFTVFHSKVLIAISSALEYV